MERKNNPISNRKSVLSYYERSEEKGYWGFLNGICHYGYSESEDEPFNMESAQLRMENILGETLNLPPSSLVLDAGCGYGPVARTLNKNFNLKITGIDLIHDRLKKANILSGYEENPNIAFSTADYHSLPFADESFDGVYTMETLVHASDYKSVLKEFYGLMEILRWFFSSDSYCLSLKK